MQLGYIYNIKCINHEQTQLLEMCGPAFIAVHVGSVDVTDHIS